MQPALEQQAPIAQQVAMVAGEHDDGVLLAPQRAHMRHHLANGIIDVGQAAVVQCDRLACLLLGAGEAAVAGSERCIALALGT